MDEVTSSIIALHKSGKSQKQILTALSCFKINRQRVYRTVKRFYETGSIKKRYGGGRKKTATGTENVRKLRNRLHHKPQRSARKWGLDLKISDRSVRRILKNHIHVKPYKIQKVQELSVQNKQQRLR